MRRFSALLTRSLSGVAIIALCVAGLSAVGRAAGLAAENPALASAADSTVPPGASNDIPVTISTAKATFPAQQRPTSTPKPAAPAPTPTASATATPQGSLSVSTPNGTLAAPR